MTEYTLEELKIAIESSDKEKNLAIKAYLATKYIYDFIYPHGETLLHWAAAFNNADICRYLISEKKLHINIENFRGTTALHYAAMNNCAQSIGVLLEFHANPRIRSGFSSLFPFQVTTDPTLRSRLETADEELVPITGFDSGPLRAKDDASLQASYNYRYYMMLLSNLNYYLRKIHLPSGLSGPIYDVTLHPDAIKIFESDGIIGLAQKCQDAWISSLSLFSSEKHGSEPKPMCLACNKSSPGSRCSKCRAVYFCSKECQKVAHLFHKFDCPSRNSPH